jgi:hypothetical protein
MISSRAFLYAQYILYFMFLMSFFRHFFAVKSRYSCNKCSLLWQQIFSFPFDFFVSALAAFFLLFLSPRLLDSTLRGEVFLGKKFVMLLSRFRLLVLSIKYNLFSMLLESFGSSSFYFVLTHLINFICSLCM